MNQKAFTLVEVIISIGVASVIAMTMLFITINFIGDTARARLTADLAVESQNLLRAMVEDVRLAGTLSATNQNTDVNSPTGGWVTNDPSNIIIIDLPAINSSRDIIYNTLTGYPYDNEVVYFADGSTMYRRTIIDPAATGNAVKTSCPAASASATCPQDRLFTKYLKDLTFTFYDDSNNTTANATLARSVQITVKLERKINGKNVTFNNTIRTTLRNR